MTRKYYTIVPVYNEERHIRQVLRKLQKYTRNIIVVNDGSYDRTAQIVMQFPQVTLVNLKINQGKGAAMHAGARKAWRLGADGIIFLDGDNQHNPAHLPKFHQALDNNEDIIIGVRVVKAKIPIHRKLGNQLGAIFMKTLFQIDLKDILCGYRALSKVGYRNVFWTSTDYGVESEMLALIGRKKLRFKTIKVSTIYIDKYKGFSIPEGIRILAKYPYWRVRKI